MEFVLAFLTLSSLLLFSGSVDARKNPGEYWNDVMKDQQMPEAIRGLLPSNSGFDTPLEKQNKEQKFNLDVSLQSTAIIYHEHKEVEKAAMKDFKTNSTDSSINVRTEEKKSVVKDIKHRK
ncbi:organ-specific protein P4-like [Telopea speciosissima]|uniref:organ-specific protein P4-like n=1 Tax=Telopea speciosissima TaxID=54955 RepID=UPI001CC81C9A|nr:organ-specific protein P4-like [Telopea speciosissima]